MNNEILMCGTEPIGQLYKDTKAEATSIAPIEVSPTESSHNVGTHIMYGGIRYKVTSSISVGDTLTIGENIVAENVESNIVYPNGTSVKDKIDELTVKYKDLPNGSDYSTFVDSKWHAYAKQTGNVVVVSLSLRLKNYTTTGSGWSELFTLPSEISAPSLSLTQNVVTQENQGIMINIEPNRKISIQNTRAITQSILATQITFII